MLDSSSSSLTYRYIFQRFSRSSFLLALLAFFFSSSFFFFFTPRHEPGSVPSGSRIREGVG
jgi:hypothetical protein